MKQITTALIISTILIISSCATPTMYQSSGFDKSRATVKTLAILPSIVTEDARKFPKGTSVDDISHQEQMDGYNIQNSLYTWFLQHQDSYTVTFQDVDKTNALLKKAAIGYDDIPLHQKSELCKILGVDAIISGKAVMSKGMSEGGAVALGALTGDWGGKTNGTTITVAIYDSTSTLLWKYDYSESGSVGSNSTDLADDLANDCSKYFPYNKPKPPAPPTPKSTTNGGSNVDYGARR